MGTKPEELQAIAKVVYDGRVTIPKKIRAALDIKIGDEVILQIRKLEK